MVKTKKTKGNNKAASTAEAQKPATAATATPPAKPIPTSSNFPPRSKIHKGRERNMSDAVAILTTTNDPVSVAAAVTGTPPAKPIPSYLDFPLKNVKKEKKDIDKREGASDAVAILTTTTAIPTPVDAAPALMPVVPAPASSFNPASNNKSEQMAEKSDGFIFMCNSRTKPDCYLHKVFGMPHGNMDVIQRIKPGTRLFLFDFSYRLLHGVYRAASQGGLNLVPEAFGGAFPAQVKFEVEKECQPLAESTLKQAIPENYILPNKFQTKLDSNQVHKLIGLFQPVSTAPQPALPQFVSAATQPAPPQFVSAVPQPAPHQFVTAAPQPAPSHFVEDRQAAPQPAPPHFMRLAPQPAPPQFLGDRLAVPQPSPLEVIRAAPQPAPPQFVEDRRAAPPPHFVDDRRMQLQFVEERRAPSSVHVPPVDSYRAEHISTAYLPPLEDPYRSSAHRTVSHLPPADDPYGSRRYLAPAHLPPPEDPYRSSAHQTVSHLPPPEDPYVSRRYLAPAHLPPSEDPYISRASADDLRHIPVHAPPPANDPYYSRHEHALPSVGQGADPYQPLPSSYLYHQLEAPRTYFPVLSDRVLSEISLRDRNTVHASDYPVRREGAERVEEAYRPHPDYLTSFPLSSYHAKYMDPPVSVDAYDHARPSSSVPVSSRYSFAGAAPSSAYR